MSCGSITIVSEERISTATPKKSNKTDKDFTSEISGTSQIVTGPFAKIAADAGIGGIVGTALALTSGSTAEAAIAIAVPLGIMGTMIWTLRQTVNIYFVHKMDKYAAIGDTKKMAFWQLWPTQIFAYLVTAIPVALLVYLGAPVVQSTIEMLSGTPLHILSVIGGLLPVIGIAMLLQMLNTRSGILLFFVLGFFLQTYSGLGMLIIAIFAGVFAYVYAELKFKTED